jgi:hypothetical protein
MFREVFEKQCLHDDSGKTPEPVAGSLYDFIYFCIELFCSCWNKQCKTILVLLCPITVGYYSTDFDDSVFWKSLHKFVEYF